MHKIVSFSFKITKHSEFLTFPFVIFVMFMWTSQWICYTHPKRKQKKGKN